MREVRVVHAFGVGGTAHGMLRADRAAQCVLPCPVHRVRSRKSPLCVVVPESDGRRLRVNLACVCLPILPTQS